MENRPTEKTGILVWKIPDFTSKWLVDGEVLTSQKFRIAGDWERWYYLMLHPKGPMSNGDRPIVASVCTNAPKDGVITGKLFLISKFGEKWVEVSFTDTFRGGTFKVCLSTPNEFLKDKPTQFPDDVLTLSCVLSTVNATVAESKAMRAAILENRVNEKRRKHSLVSDFSKIFGTNKNADVVLKAAGGEQISAHKMVMSSRSQVFESMFDRNAAEATSNEVIIQDMDIAVLSDIVRFMYTDEVVFRSVSFSLEVLAAATKYDIPLLKVLVATYLNENLSTSNVFEVLVGAHAYNEDELKTACMDLVKQEMSSVSLLADWISNLKVHPEALDIVSQCLREEA